MTPPTTPVDLDDLHERHHDHNEIEDHDSTPEYSQTFGSAIGVIKNG